MRTVNKVILIGNIAKDPLVRTTTGGAKSALFVVATNRVYKDKMELSKVKPNLAIVSHGGLSLIAVNNFSEKENSSTLKVDSKLVPKTSTMVHGFTAQRSSS